MFKCYNNIKSVVYLEVSAFDVEKLMNLLFSIIIFIVCCIQLIKLITNNSLKPGGNFMITTYKLYHNQRESNLIV
jgi:hypothetical protein